MSHLEDLVGEFLEWQEFQVIRNRKVGRLSHGGWEGELDLVGWHPVHKRLVHYEPSLDASSWAKREVRYKKKFAVGRKYILKEVFHWLPPETPIVQYAIFFGHPSGHDQIAGGKIYSVDEYVGMICREVRKRGRLGANAIPEHYPLLRTIQLLVCGYLAPPDCAETL
jgi:hypothetical protein